MNKSIIIYCGFPRETKVKEKTKIYKGVFIKGTCLECGGTGIFDCGIPECKGKCVQCKGTGIQYFGTL